MIEALFKVRVSGRGGYPKAALSDDGDDDEEPLEYSR
jgi:hypothetical protein